jgi:WD40 repeat protein
VPDWFEDVIDRLLAKEPDRRFQSAAELHALLAAHVPHHSNPQCDAATAHAEPCPFDPPTNLTRRARRKWQLRLAGLMTVPLVAGVLLGGVGGWVSGLFASPPETIVVAGDPPPPVIQRVVSHLEEPVAKPLAEFPNEAPVWSVATCPDGTHLAVGLEDGTVRIFDVKKKLLIHTIPAHTGPIWGLDFFPDGKRFVTVSDEGTMKVWDLTDKDVNLFREFSGTAGVRAVAVDQSGSNIVTGDRGGKVTVWNMAVAKADKPTHTFDHGGTVTAVAYSKDAIGATVASAGIDKSIKVWDVPNDRLRGEPLRRHTGPVYAIAFSADQRYLASAGWDGVIRLWDVGSLTEKATMIGHEGDVGSLAFTDCGQMLASGGQDGTVRLWDVDSTREKLRIKAHKSATHVVRWSKDCRMVISGGRDGFVRLWASGR